MNREDFLIFKNSNMVYFDNGATTLKPIQVRDAINKYYDEYTSTSITNYSNRILGDATGEMGPFGGNTDLDTIWRAKSSWYGDYATFAFSSAPWFGRGGSWFYGSCSGVFAFAYYTGGVYTEVGFRVVLAP